MLYCVLHYTAKVLTLYYMSITTYTLFYKYTHTIYSMVPDPALNSPQINSRPLI